MTNEELIAELSKLPPDALVRAVIRVGEDYQYDGEVKSARLDVRSGSAIVYAEW